ncbi:AraC family transcriptional regulator [uncultured Chryseobacterium sp.]|uniref:helix-turn-helix domain-containing protein n=1 Tax=uncultured Chryseobacterium sp. TaxID=259322 RepID=UPI0025EDD054|nr:AraC family transcriptional regulator [uncultured Chryseobacterium sp.]
MNTLNYILSKISSNAEERENNIFQLKYELAKLYLKIMFFGMATYMLIFYFYYDNLFFVYYLSAQIVIISTIWLLSKKVLSLKVSVSLFIIIAPLFNIYNMLYFWEYSAGSVAWLIPIPFGVQIFLGNKKVLLYSVYAISTVFLVIILDYFFNFDFPKYPQEKVKNTDVFLFLFNVLIIWLFVHYKEKITELKLLTEIEQKEKVVLPITLNERDIESAEVLFQSIDNEVKKNKLFTNSEFNISMLSTLLKTNSTYISKAIRSKGYSNVNTYINNLRIQYVKQLLAENDLEKVTLMYIYTEAGFSSQPTFNRAFKQFEGITPSDYIALNDIK